MDPAKSRRDLHQFAQLNRAGKVTRCRHQNRKHHSRLAVARAEPREALLHFQQLHEIVQHLLETVLQRVAFVIRATIHGNRFAVFAHPHQVMPEVGFQPLLLEIQRRHATAQEMSDDAAAYRVQQSHPHHETGDGELVLTNEEIEAARHHPQNADKAAQRDQRVQQAQAELHRTGREHLYIFLNPLVGVVRTAQAVVTGQGLAQFDLVKNLVRGPARQKVARHPGAPPYFKQLGQVKTVDRHHNESTGQHAEHFELFPEHRFVVVLQGVIKHPVPVIQQHQHIHLAKIERHTNEQ